MNRVDLDNYYIKSVYDNEQDYYADYKVVVEKVNNSTAIYKGKPIPFLYMPKFYREEDLERFKGIKDKMFTIMNKVIDRYLVDGEFRKKFHFSDDLEQLILTEHRYKSNIPMARVDIFYREDGDFKFCEINTDGSSAMNEDRELARILKDSRAMKDMMGDYNVESFELFESWVNEIVNIYKESNENENPTIGIVDFTDRASLIEFEIFVDTFKRLGYEAHIIDPRELIYKENQLFWNGKNIDIVYRRLVTRDMMERKSEIPDFIEACKNPDICIVGSIKTQIVHNKIFFKILHDEDTLKHLTVDENAFVREHVPYTVEFNRDLDMNDIINNKDRWLLKPMDLYASKGVYTGLDYNEEQWSEILKECLKEDYLLQEYYMPNKTDLIEFVNGKPIARSFNNITGLYVYNENLYGLYSRIGKNPIISGLHDCFTLANLKVKKK